MIRANGFLRLVAINAVQLVIALISNMVLLMNMAQRIRFSVAQPITIIGWYVEILRVLKHDIDLLGIYLHLLSSA